MGGRIGVGEGEEGRLSDLVAVLRSTAFLAGLPPQALTELASAVVPLTFTAGQVVCEQGDIGTSAFLVATGRVRASAGERVLGEAGRGELVGEVSLLTGEPRTATVRALRDSEVIRIDAEVFHRILARHPDCYRALSSQLVRRFRDVVADVSRDGAAAIVTLLHDGRAASLASAELLIERLGPDVAVVHDRTADLASLEARHDLVVVLPDPADRALCAWAKGQADRTFLFVDASAPPGPAPVYLRSGPFDLVLVQSPDVGRPSGTPVWLEHYQPQEHHHVRRGAVSDHDRLVRRLQQRPHVLVLSGGGARGLAHGGLFRALEEHDVPIDVVFGVSAGAVAAALIAGGADHETGTATGLEFFGGRGSPIDLTIPTVALASGARINTWIQEMVGETTHQEDLWLPTVIVSANLTTIGLHLHRHGLLWRALRATTAIPGVFPPVAEPAGVLVDGGLVANLPVELARSLYPGAVVIASDVGRRLELDPHAFPASAEIGGWQAARSRLRPGGRVPGMVRILTQLTALGGLAAGEARGDLHVDFDLDTYGMLDFKRGSEIVAAGYTQAEPQVADWVAAARSGTVAVGAR